MNIIAVLRQMASEHRQDGFSVAGSDLDGSADQIEADDALLLALEWNCGSLMRRDEPQCPCCGNDRSEGHSTSCDLGRRCDEARDRWEV